MKIAIVGSTGYIAKFLFTHLEKKKNIEEILRIGQKEETAKLNLLNPEKFDYDRLRQIDYVIFTAAVSSPDRCSAEYELSWNINVSGTKYFIEKALEYKCRVLFFSSDAVFGDIDGEIYTEDSATKAETAYGKMKKDIEDSFQDNVLFKSIRLSYVVSVKDKFVQYCIKCIKEEKVAEVYHPFYRNCIVIDDVLDVVMWLLENWNDYEPSLFNVAGKELVSRVRIADEINRFTGNKLQYIIVRPNEQFYKNRPKITQMRSLYAEQYGVLKDSSFSEKIKKELENISYE